MARKRHTPEQVINKLREAEVAIAEGSTVAEAARRTGVTGQTFYRWRKPALCPALCDAKRKFASGAVDGSSFMVAFPPNYGAGVLK